MLQRDDAAEELFLFIDDTHMLIVRARAHDVTYIARESKPDLPAYALHNEAVGRFKQFALVVVVVIYLAAGRAHRGESKRAYGINVKPIVEFPRPAERVYYIIHKYR